MSLPFRKTVCLYLGKPKVRPEPVLTPSATGSGAPDDVAAHFYGTVLQDAGKFRMWYYACHRGLNPDWPARKMQQLAGTEEVSGPGMRRRNSAASQCGCKSR